MPDHELREKLLKLQAPEVPGDKVEEALSRVTEALDRDDPGTVTIPEVRAWTWREWLWPSPIAWAAIAAIWMMILAANGPSASRRVRRAEVAGKGEWPHPTAVSPLLARDEYEKQWLEIQRLMQHP